MSKRSNSSLFLMEQIVVIIIFAVCASACVKIFVESYLTTVQAQAISHALLVAESGAETYKAVAGDIAQLAETLGGERQANGEADVYYNSEWQVCSLEEAVYVLRIEPLNDAAPLCVDLAVVKIAEAEQLITFTVAAGGVRHE